MRFHEGLMGFGVWGLSFRVSGSGCSCRFNESSSCAPSPCLWFMVYGFGFMVFGLKSGVSGSGCMVRVQGYLAHLKTLTPLGPPQGHRQRPTVGS